jgi:acetyl esterase/lipase
MGVDRKFRPIKGFRFLHQSQLLHHTQIIAHAPVIDDPSVPHRIKVDDFNLKMLLSRCDADKQPAVDRESAHPAVISTLLAVNDHQIARRHQINDVDTKIGKRAIDVFENAGDDGTTYGPTEIACVCREIYVERAVDAGVDARVDVWQGMAHGFVSEVGKLPAADQALGKIGAFLAERLDAAPG